MPVMWQLQTVTSPEETGVAQDELRREIPACEQRLGAIQVSEDQVQELRPLGQSSLDERSVGRRDQEWQRIELPGPLHPLGVAVDIVGDTVFTDEALRVLPALVQFAQAHR